MHLPFPAMRLPQCEGDLVRAALAAAKARGKQLRTPDPAGAVDRMRVAEKAQAAQFAANVLTRDEVRRIARAK
jgi:hypothetical protein